MNKTRFPDEGDLRLWVGLLQASQIGPDLPAIDEGWYLQMLSCFSVASLRPDCTEDSCLAGAAIFYKIIKNHYLIDGNKRSSVMCVYLFFFVNGLNLDIPWKEVYELAREVAQSKSRPEEVERIVAAGFSSSCRNLP